MNLKKTIKELNKYINKQDFEKLKIKLQILHNKNNILELKEEKELERLKEKIKELIKEEIKSNLLSQQYIESIFIELTYLLGSNFHKEIKELIIEKTLLKYKIILQNSIPIITHMKDIILSINKLEEIFDNCLVFTSRYSNNWNIPGIFIFSASCYLKQKISDFIFLKGIDNNYLPEVIKKIILFEKKILKKHFSENCCKINEINNNKDTKIDFYKQNMFQRSNCLHKKMLSRMFIPFLDLFIDYLLETNLIIDYKSIEMNVLSSFIILFQKIGLALTHINYFECLETQKIFLKICDKKIINLLKKLKTTRKLKEIIICLNTLIFIENTINGLKNILDSSYKLETIKFKNEIQIIFQQKMEESFKFLITLKFKKTFSEMFLKILKQINFEDLDFLMKKQIINSFLRNIFLKISNSIIRVEDSKIMIHQIEICFEFLSRWFDENPFITIRNYLYIFSICPSNLNLFISNYFQYSNMRFSFLHILKCLDNKIWNEELYLLYNKIKENKKMSIIK